MAKRDKAIKRLEEEIIRAEAQTKQTRENLKNQNPSLTDYQLKYLVNDNYSNNLRKRLAELKSN